MNRLALFVLVLAVVGSAAWAYHINYRTRTTLDRIDFLRDRIANEREEVEVLRVEWAYLNAPDRLARLVAQFNDTLKLEPMGPAGFDEVAAVPFAPEDAQDGAPGDGTPGTPLADVLVVSERQPLVAALVPQPAPRPASWGQ